MHYQELTSIPLGRALKNDLAETSPSLGAIQTRE